MFHVSEVQEIQIIFVHLSGAWQDLKLSQTEMPIARKDGGNN